MKHTQVSYTVGMIQIQSEAHWACWLEGGWLAPGVLGAHTCYRGRDLLPIPVRSGAPWSQATSSQGPPAGLWHKG